MARCPNCGRETLRTEDWACQWCSYPLPDGVYKSVKKTYRQLKEERLGEVGTMQTDEKEPEIELKQDLERIKDIDIEPEPVSCQDILPIQADEAEAEIACEAEEKAEKIEEPQEGVIESNCEDGEETEEAEEKAEKEIEKAEAACEAEEEIKEAEETEEGAEEAETVCGAEEEPEEKKEEPAKVEEESVCETEGLEAEAQPELPAAEVEISVSELFATYWEDQPAADEKFTDKIMKISGTVASIDLKDILDTYYIRLTGADDDILNSVQCFFDKRHENALRQLEKGQQVAVQGRFNGSVIAVRIVDCRLLFGMIV